jgi:hypothetical protein
LYRVNSFSTIVDSRLISFTLQKNWPIPEAKATDSFVQSTHTTAFLRGNWNHIALDIPENDKVTSKVTTITGDIEVSVGSKTIGVNYSYASIIPKSSGCTLGTREQP